MIFCFFAFVLKLQLIESAIFCFAFTEFVNFGNFKMLLLFSSELNCATAMYFYNLMLSIKLRATCKKDLK